MNIINIWLDGAPIDQVLPRPLDEDLDRAGVQIRIDDRRIVVRGDDELVVIADEGRRTENDLRFECGRRRSRIHQAEVGDLPVLVLEEDVTVAAIATGLRQAVPVPAAAFASGGLNCVVAI